jgi:hypothetical protein
MLLYIFNGFKVFRATENVMTARIAFTEPALITGLLLSFSNLTLRCFCMSAGYLGGWLDIL